MNNLEILALRKSLGLTQAAMGDRLGVGWLSVWRLEHDVTKARGAVLKMLEGMKLPVK